MKIWKLQIIYYTTSPEVMADQKFLVYIILTAGFLPCLYLIGMNIVKIQFSVLSEKFSMNTRSNVLTTPSQNPAWNVK